MSIAKIRLREGLELMNAERLDDKKGKEVWVAANGIDVIQMHAGEERVEWEQAKDIFESIGLGRWYYDKFL